MTEEEHDREHREIRYLKTRIDALFSEIDELRCLACGLKIDMEILMGRTPRIYKIDKNE